MPMPEVRGISIEAFRAAQSEGTAAESSIHDSLFLKPKSWGEDTPKSTDFHVFAG